MAALMIPGGRLTDKFGRKRCFIAGLTLYGIGALISAVSPGLGVLIFGNSISGVIFTATTVGLLATSLAAERLAKRRPQRTLVMVGFAIAAAGIAALLAMVIGNPSAWAFTPGLLLIGAGIGLMLTPSVNIVASFGESLQGEVSGPSRSVSNLGSSLGAAIAGAILVAGITATPERSYGLAMIVLAIVAVAGLTAARLLPRAFARAQPPGRPPIAERRHSKESPHHERANILGEWRRTPYFAACCTGAGRLRLARDRTPHGIRDLRSDHRVIRAGGKRR
jgi:MFS family permease